MTEKLQTYMDPFTLSAEQLEFYKENGYLRIKNVWPKEDIDLLREHLDEYADGHFTNKLNAHLYKSVKQLHRGKKMCDIGDAVLDGRAIPIGSITFYCKPNNKIELGSRWHQDNYAGKVPDGSNYLNLAIPIDDADETNGALWIVPGSHKLGLIPFTPSPNFERDSLGRLVQINPIGDADTLEEYSVEGLIDLPCIQLKYNAGDVLVVNGLLVHKADPNPHPTRWRRTIYSVYVKEGEPFWPGWTAKRQILERYDSPEYKED